jgi:hypothetical protein
MRKDTVETPEAKLIAEIAVKALTWEKTWLEAQHAKLYPETDRGIDAMAAGIDRDGQMVAIKSSSEFRTFKSALAVVLKKSQSVSPTIANIKKIHTALIRLKGHLKGDEASATKPIFDAVVAFTGRAYNTISGSAQAKILRAQKAKDAKRFNKARPVHHSDVKLSNTNVVALKEKYLSNDIFNEEKDCEPKALVDFQRNVYFRKSKDGRNIKCTTAAEIMSVGGTAEEAGALTWGGGQGFSLFADALGGQVLGFSATDKFCSLPEGLDKSVWYREGDQWHVVVDRTIGSIKMDSESFQVYKDDSWVSINDPDVAVVQPLAHFKLTAHIQKNSAGKFEVVLDGFTVAFLKRPSCQLKIMPEFCGSEAKFYEGAALSPRNDFFCGDRFPVKTAATAAVVAGGDGVSARRSASALVALSVTGEAARAAAKGHRAASSAVVASPLASGVNNPV